MSFEDLKNPELQEKLKACTNGSELAELAREEGVELSDEQLESIAGGEWDKSNCMDKYCRSVHK